MSDKPLVQQALASDIAELLLKITTTSSSLAFLRGFWETTVREWGGIDRLRCLELSYSLQQFQQLTTIQNRQVLYACSTVRQCLLPVTHADKMGR
jgi:hypothetical protein